MIELFSPNGLNHSLLIPIFLGLVLTWFFTERFGWVFSGLVVSGYLAPILAFRPSAGVMVIVEALLTFALARGLYAFSRRTGWLTPTFGRDRFLLLLIASLVVRLTVESLLLPMLLGDLFGEAGSVASHGIGAVGLVVVPLVANLLWKPGAARGLLQVAVVTALVSVFLTFVLDPFTNFSLDRLETVYEDVALEFAASAKVEIMIIVGAAMASRLNYYQGWDFGGILLPPLLAVALLEPLRLGATVVEAFVALYAGRALLALPGLNRLNVSGPRLVVFFFSILVALRMLEGWLLYLLLPERGFTDISGFGYIISALLATKLYTKGPRITIWPTLLITVVTFVVGTAVSMLVAFAVGMTSQSEGPLVPDSSGRATPLHLAVLRTSRLVAPNKQKLIDFQPGTDLHSALDLVIRTGRVQANETVLKRLRSRGVRVTLYRTSEDEVYLALSVPGYPEICLLRVGARRVPVVVSIDPDAEPFAASLGAASLIAKIRPDIIVAGAPKADQGLPSRSVLTYFARRFPKHFLLEVRGSGASKRPVLDVYGSLSGHVPPLSILRDVMPNMRTHLSGHLDTSRIRKLSALYRGGLARLSLGLDDADNLAARLLEVKSHQLPSTYLHVYLRARPAAPPAIYESRPEWRDTELMTLKVGLVRDLLRAGSDRHLAGLTVLAQALDLDLDLLIEPGEEARRYLILRDRFGVAGTDGALIVNTAADAQNLHVEVPSPGVYFNTDQAGCLLFQASRARTLSLGGVGWPQEGILAPVVTRAAWRRTLFHAVHQGLVEIAIERSLPPPPVLQVRGRAFVSEGFKAAGVLVPPDVIRPAGKGERGALRPWINACRVLGWSAPIRDPLSREDLDSGTSLQARYRRFLGLGGISGIWLTAPHRRKLDVEQPSPTLRRALLALGFSLEKTKVLDTIATLRPLTEIPGTAKVEEHLRRFQLTRSLASLAAARDAVPAGWTTRVLEDEEAGALVVALESPRGEVLLINLLGAGEQRAPLGAEAFLRQRAYVFRGQR
ncbi:MAG: hypothetical protein JKY65_12575 [Planctomycetes bacterium]|nr:hypothetical protein [Planctomycetota bacterium]